MKCSQSGLLRPGTAPEPKLRSMRPGRLPTSPKCFFDRSWSWTRWSQACHSHTTLPVVLPVGCISTTLSAKRQRTLPTACKVYDLLNFASEVATHHADEAGSRTLQAYLGELVSGEYDLEGTVDQFNDWQDFFVGSEETASTMADMNRRSSSRG